MTVTETVGCDYCNHCEYEVIYNQSNWKSLCIGKFAFVKCVNCQAIYLNPRPTPENLVDYYPDDYAPFRTAIEDECNILIRFMRNWKMERLRRIIEFYFKSSNGSLLDVGCSTGLFLNEMAQAGWSTFGIELSPTASKYANDRFGLNIYNGYLEDTDFPPESFDVITYWDVLEHVFSPRLTLELTNKYLRLDGLVAINIPNWNSIDRRIFGPYWIGYDPPRHLHVFKHDILEKLLNESGFQILTWKSVMPSYFSSALSVIRWFQVEHPKWVNLVENIFMFPGFRFIFAPYFFIVDTLKKGGVISVIAKKVR